MMMTCRPLALLFTAATVIAAPAIVAAQPVVPREASASADAAARADVFYRRGLRLYSDGKYVEAEAELQSAWELNPTFDVAYNLGNTKYQLKKHKEAAQYLSHALRHWPLMKAAAKLKTTAENRLAESRAQVGALAVTAGAPGAEVLVDGKAVGKAPLEGEVFVEPGEHRVEARLEGYAPASQTVKVAKGGRAEVTLAMVLAKSEAQEAAPVVKTDGGTSAQAGAPAAELAPGAPVEPASPQQQRSWVPVIALGAASVVGLGVGIGMTVASRNARSDADVRRAEIMSRGPGCVHAPSDVASACSAFDESTRRAGTLGTGAVVAYAASGALAAGALVYALWPRSSVSSSAVGVLPTAWAAQGETSLGVVGVW
ncbi:PEGA domain-containing protein [Sorangium sp. So ce134]